MQKSSLPEAACAARRPFSPIVAVRQVLFTLAAVVAIVATTGCSMRLPDSTGGRSGIQQMLEAQAYEDATHSIDWRHEVSGSRVYLRAVAAPADKISSEYLELVVKHAISSQGIFPEYVATEAEADIVLHVMVDSLGTDTYMTRTDNLVTWLLGAVVGIFYTVDVHQRTVALIRVYSYHPETGTDLDRETAFERTYFRRVRILLGLIPFNVTNLRTRP